MFAMTLQELGRACGVTAGYLSQVERGNAVPTLGTLAEIAAALDVGIDYFIATPRKVDSVTRAGEREQFAVAGSSVIYEQIGADFPGHELTSVVMNVPPGYQSETVQHMGEEIMFVLQGEIVQVVDGHEFRLREGDSIHYLGQQPHSWSNPGSQTARVLFVGRMQFGATSINLAHRKVPTPTDAAEPKPLPVTGRAKLT